MFHERLPAACAVNPADGPREAAGREGPAGGAAASAGSTDGGLVRAPEANRSDRSDDRGNSNLSDHAWAQGKARPEPVPEQAGSKAAGGSLPQFPSGRTREGASTTTTQPATPLAEVDDAPLSPPVSALPHGVPAGGATFSGVPVRAMEDVMAARTEQILKFGHTIEHDRQTALYSPREFGQNGEYSLMRQIARQLSSAIEYAAYGHGKLDVTRRNLVKTAALCLAAIDWIDAELEEQDAAARDAAAPGPDEDFL